MDADRPIRVERHLELSAVNLGGRRIVLVQLLGEDYHKKKDLLQRFREKGLDYEILFKTQQALNRAHDLLRKQAAKLKELSLVDPLTGLNNRRGFLTLAEHQIKIADIDEFNFSLYGLGQFQANQRYARTRRRGQCACCRSRPFQKDF